jgi:hypothetical protein
MRRGTIMHGQSKRRIIVDTIQELIQMPGKRKPARVRGCIQLGVAICLTLLLTGPASAQYGGGGAGSGGTGTSGTPGYVPPKGGYGSGAAIGIGAGAAAGVGALYLVLHHRGAVTGCVRSTDDGMALVDDKRNKSYSIIPGGIALKPGERLQLRGKKSTNAGVANFQAKKVVRDLGTCNAESAASPAHSSAQ